MLLCCTVSLVTSEFQYIVEWNENIQHLNSPPSCGHSAHFLAMAFSVFFLPSHLFLIAACQFLVLSSLAASFCALSCHLFFGSPMGLLPPGHHSTMCFWILVSNILTICPAHL